MFVCWLITVDTEMMVSPNEGMDEEESTCLMKSRTGDITYHFGIIDILTLFK